MSKVGPLHPDAVVDAKTESIPDEVFLAFNRLIAEHWDGRQARITQKEAAARCVLALDKVMPGVTTQQLYDRHWLDVEPSYRKAGWIVEYDKPAYYAGENFEPYFLFKKATTRAHGRDCTCVCCTSGP